MVVFTERELQVIQLVVDGLTNRDIAAQLGLSVDGVKGRMRKVFNKSGMSTRSELIGFALRNGHAKL